MTATEEFIFGRLDNLGLITTGWYYMHQTMSPEDRRGFEKMINMPGFSVEKFENDFLAHKINPFEQNGPRKNGNTDRNNAQRRHDKITALLELKSHLNGYFQKFGDPLGNLLDSLLSTPENAVKGPHLGAVREYIPKLATHREPNTPKKDTYRGPIVLKANAPRKYDNARKDTQNAFNVPRKDTYRGPIVLKADHARKPNVSKKETHREPNVPKIDATKETNVPEIAGEKESNVPKVDEQQDPNAPKKDACKEPNTLTTGPLRNSSFPSLEPLGESIEVEHHEEQMRPTYANTVKKHIQETVPHIVEKKVSPPAIALAVDIKKVIRQAPQSPTIQPILIAPTKTETVRNVPEKSSVKPASTKPEPVTSNPETPCLLSPLVESDVVSISMSRSVGTPDSSLTSDVPEQKPKTKKPDDPEKWTGRDGRRYRKEKRKAEEMAQALLKVKEPAVESPPEDKPANHTPTGKEKRRLKDKLRKERKAEELLHGNSSAEQAHVPPEDKPVVKAEQVIETQQIVASDQAVAIEQVVVTEKVVESEQIIETKQLIETEQIVPTKHDIATEQAIETEKVVETKIEEAHTVIERTVGEVAAVEPIPVAEDPIPIVEQVVVTPPVTSPQKLEIYKYKAVSKKSGKSKRGNAKKATSLVIDNKKTSHTVDLIPGEYQIVKVDRNNDSGGSLAINMDLDKSVQQMKNCAVSSTSPNCFIPDDISRNVLDTGKWLAYVIDDQNPHHPKIGEVSTDDVADTIAHFEARQAASDLAMLTNSRYTRTNLPELNVADTPRKDAESVRKILSQMKLSNRLEPVPNVIDVTDVAEDGVDDLTAFLNAENSETVVFRTEFAQKTAALFADNDHFKEFCMKYASSKYTSTQIGKLIRCYIDKRIIFHYEMFEMRGDQESCRIAKSWTLVDEPTPYVLMIMLYLNSPISNVHYYQLEKTLFPQPAPFL